MCVSVGYPDRPSPSRLDISEHFISWHLASKDIGNAHEDFLVATFKYELQDLQAYIEIIKVRRRNVHACIQQHTSSCVCVHSVYMLFVLVCA